MGIFLFNLLLFLIINRLNYLYKYIILKKYERNINDAKNINLIDYFNNENINNNEIDYCEINGILLIYLKRNY